MSKKLEFIERVGEAGAKLAVVCREFNISRQTGHKWRKRYLELGAAGLEEESRRPKSSPLSVGEDLVMAVLESRDAHSSWGPKKIHQALRRRFGESTPSKATIARMLSRFGRIKERRARPLPNVVEQAPSVRADKPHDVWTVDFKGWWQSHDGERCEPLTVRDAFSRFVFTVTLTRTTVVAVRAVFEGLFRKYGLPSAIQCDNGCPFIHVRARAGLSKLSAWWVSLGIRIVRSRPGCPQDNGAHERMHRDIAVEVQTAPAHNAAVQQRILDKWRQEFNHVRPHEALGGRTPGELYRNSERRYQAPAIPVYPPHFKVTRVVSDGRIRIGNERYHVSASLAGHQVGLEQLDAIRWRVWFFHIDCGELEMLPMDFDNFVPHTPPRESKRLERHDARRRGLHDSPANVDASTGKPARRATPGGRARRKRAA